MKKTLLSLALLAAGSASYAQIGAGSIMLGGNIGYNSTTSTLKLSGTPALSPAPKDAVINDVATINIGLQGGYFIVDGLAIGLMVNYSNTTTAREDQKTVAGVTTDYNWDDTKGVTDLGLFLRKYFEVADNFQLFAQLDGGMRIGTATAKTVQPDPNNPGKFILIDDPDTDVTGFGVNIVPGFTYFPSESWGIDFSLRNFLSFRTDTDTQNDTSNPAQAIKSEVVTNTFGLNISTMAPTLGIFYYIGK